MANADRLTLRQQIAAVFGRLALAIGGISGVRPNLADDSPIWRAATISSRRSVIACEYLELSMFKPPICFLCVFIRKFFFIFWLWIWFRLGI